MQSAVELVNDVDGVVARALLIHYAIVTIHPTTTATAGPRGC